MIITTHEQENTSYGSTSCTGDTNSICLLTECWR